MPHYRSSAYECSAIQTPRYLPDHSLILSLESEYVIIQLFPRFAKLSIDMVHDVLESLVERLLRVRLLVEVAGTILDSVDITSLESVEAVHRDDELGKYSGSC